MTHSAFNGRPMSCDRLTATIREMIEQASPRELIRDVFRADIGPDVPDPIVENFVDAVNDAFA